MEYSIDSYFHSNEIDEATLTERLRHNPDAAAVSLNQIASAAGVSNADEIAAVSETNNSSSSPPPRDVVVANDYVAVLLHDGTLVISTPTTVFDPTASISVAAAGKKSGTSSAAHEATASFRSSTLTTRAPGLPPTSSSAANGLRASTASRRCRRVGTVIGTDPTMTSSSSPYAVIPNLVTTAPSLSTALLSAQHQAATAQEVHNLLREREYARLRRGHAAAGRSQHTASTNPTAYAARRAHLLSSIEQLRRDTSGLAAAATATSSAISAGSAASVAEGTHSVPEHLIEQVQAILRRPRPMIIRELLRANLDVNRAVNILLSRDESEAVDQQQEEESILALHAQRRRLEHMQQAVSAIVVPPAPPPQSSTAAAAAAAAPPTTTTSSTVSVAPLSAAAASQLRFVPTSDSDNNSLSGGPTSNSSEFFRAFMSSAAASGAVAGAAGLSGDDLLMFDADVANSAAGGVNEIVVDSGGNVDNHAAQYSLNLSNALYSSQSSASDAVNNSSSNSSSMVEPSPLSLRHFSGPNSHSTANASSNASTAFHDPGAAIGAPPPNYGTVSTTSSSSMLHVPPPSALYYSPNFLAHRNSSRNNTATVPSTALSAVAGGPQLITAVSNSINSKRHATEFQPSTTSDGSGGGSGSGQFRFDAAEKWKVMRNAQNDTESSAVDAAKNSAVQFRFIAQMKSHLLGVTLETGRLVQIDPITMTFVSLVDEESGEKLSEPPTHTAVARFPLLCDAQVVQIDACALRATMVLKTLSSKLDETDDIIVDDSDDNFWLLTIIDDSFGAVLSTEYRQKLEGCMPLKNIRTKAMKAVLTNSEAAQSSANSNASLSSYMIDNEYYDSTTSTRTRNPIRLIREIRSCAFYSVITLCNGHSYWFGVPPFGYRLWDNSGANPGATTAAAGTTAASAKIFTPYSILTPDDDAGKLSLSIITSESAAATKKRSASRESSGAPFKSPFSSKIGAAAANGGGVLEVGSAVRLKSRAVIEAGAVAVRIRDGWHVTCGTLLEPCWGTSDIADGIKLEFQIISTVSEQQQQQNFTSASRRILTARRPGTTAAASTGENRRETSMEVGGWGDVVEQQDMQPPSRGAEKRKLSEWIDVESDGYTSSYVAAAENVVAGTASSDHVQNAAEDSSTIQGDVILSTPERNAVAFLQQQSSSPFSPRAHYSPPPVTPLPPAPSLQPPPQPPRTERWPLNEVVFLQQKGSNTVGTVLKLDGLLAAVYFGDTSDAESDAAVRQILLAATNNGRNGEKVAETPQQQPPHGASFTFAVLELSRLIKREDLIVVGKVDFSTGTATTAAVPATSINAVGLAIPPCALNHIPFINYNSSRSVVCCDVSSPSSTSNADFIYALIGTAGGETSSSSSRLSIVCYSLTQQTITRQWKFLHAFSPPITRKIIESDMLAEAGDADVTAQTRRPKLFVQFNNMKSTAAVASQPTMASSSSSGRPRMMLNPSFAPSLHSARSTATSTTQSPAVVMMLVDCYGVPYPLVPDATGKFLKPLLNQLPLAPVHLMRSTVSVVSSNRMSNFSLPSSSSSQQSSLPATILTIVRQKNELTKLITDAECNKFEVCGTVKLDTRFHYNCNVLHALAHVESRWRASTVSFSTLEANLAPIFKAGNKKIVRDLLCERNTFGGGMTPVQYAIYLRAYDVAAVLLMQILKLKCAREALMPANNTSSLAETMEGGSGDGELSPLIMLARNALCAFKFTGSEHVQQYVYECRTCGLVNSLCCCASCAYNCHRGHECRLKKASPSAFCDCQQTCCNGYCLDMKMAAFEQAPMLMAEKKFRLFKKLLTFPFLLSVVTSQGENLLHFIVNNASREVEEHRQYLSALTRSIKPASSSSSSLSNISTSKSNLLRLLIAEHSFTLRIVREVMRSKDAVKICILSGAFHMRQMPSNGGPRENVDFSSEIESEESTVMNSRRVVLFLDKFVGDLLVKAQPNEALSDFILCLKSISNDGQKKRDSNGKSMFSDTQIVERILRSVWRVYCAMRVQVSLKLGWHINHNTNFGKPKSKIVPGGVEIHRALASILKNKNPIENGKNFDPGSKPLSSLLLLSPYRRHHHLNSSAGSSATNNTNRMRQQQQQATIQAIMNALSPTFSETNINLFSGSSSHSDPHSNMRFLRGAIADYAAAAVAGSSSSSSNSRRLRRQQAAVLQQHNDIKQAEIETTILALTTVLMTSAITASSTKSPADTAQDDEEIEACASLMSLAVVPAKLNSTSDLSTMAQDRWTVNFETIMDTFPVQALKIISESANAVLAPLRNGMMMPTFVRIPKLVSLMPVGSESSSSSRSRHAGGISLARTGSRAFMPYGHHHGSSSSSSSPMDMAYVLANTFTIPLDAVRSSAAATGFVEETVAEESHHEAAEQSEEMQDVSRTEESNLPSQQQLSVVNMLKETIGHEDLMMRGVVEAGENESASVASDSASAAAGPSAAERSRQESSIPIRLFAAESEQASAASSSANVAASLSAVVAAPPLEAVVRQAPDGDEDIVIMDENNIAPAPVPVYSLSDFSRSNDEALLPPPPPSQPSDAASAASSAGEDDEDDHEEHDEAAEHEDDEHEDDDDDEEEDEEDEEDEEEDDDDDDDEDAILAAEAAESMAEAEEAEEAAVHAAAVANAGGSAAAAAAASATVSSTRQALMGLREAMQVAARNPHHRHHHLFADEDDEEIDDGDVIPESEDESTFAAQAVLDDMTLQSQLPLRTASEIAAEQRERRREAVSMPAAAPFDVLLDAEDDQFLGVFAGSGSSGPGLINPGRDEDIELIGFNGAPAGGQPPSVWYGRPGASRSTNASSSANALDFFSMPQSLASSSALMNSFEEYDMAVAAAAAANGRNESSYRSVLAAAANADLSSAANAMPSPPIASSAARMPSGFTWAVGGQSGDSVGRRSGPGSSSRNSLGIGSTMDRSSRRANSIWPGGHEADGPGVINSEDDPAYSSVVRRIHRAYAARLSSATGVPASVANTASTNTTQQNSTLSANTATRTNLIASTTTSASGAGQQNRSTSMANANSTHVSAAQQQSTRNPHGPPTPSSSAIQPQQSNATIETTQIMLARTFSIHVRQLSRTISNITKSLDVETVMNDAEQIESLISSQTGLIDTLMPTWLWLISLLDSLEGQLRYGFALRKSRSKRTASSVSRSADVYELLLLRATSAARNSLAGPSSSSSGVGSVVVGQNHEANNFLHYAISLMRSANDENGLSMPALEIEAYKHVAICFDAVLEFWRVLSISLPMLLEKSRRLKVGAAKSSMPRNASTKSVVEHLGDSSFASLFSTSSTAQQKPAAVSADYDLNLKYFGRSPSTDTPGRRIYPNEPFSQNLNAAIPLAIRPYLYQQQARPEDMFSSIDPSAIPPKLSIDAYVERTTQLNRFASAVQSDSSSSQTIAELNDADYNSSQILSNLPSFWHMIAAWRYSLRLFACAFLSDMPALLREPYFAAPFHVKEMLFRKLLETQQNRLNTSAATAAASVAAHGSSNHTHMVMMAQQERELKLHVSRDDRSRFIGETFRKLNQAFSSGSSLIARNTNSGSSYITGAMSAGFYFRVRLNVSFENEPAEGAGVTRSFFTAMADYLRDSNAKLPVGPANTGLINWWSLAIGTATPGNNSNDLSKTASSGMCQALRVVAASAAAANQQRLSAATQPPPLLPSTGTANSSSEAAALWGLFSNNMQQPQQQQQSVPVASSSNTAVEALASATSSSRVPISAEAADSSSNIDTSTPQQLTFAASQPASTSSNRGTVAPGLLPASEMDETLPAVAAAGVVADNETVSLNTAQSNITVSNAAVVADSGVAAAVVEANSAAVPPRRRFYARRGGGRMVARRAVPVPARDAIRLRMEAEDFAAHPSDSPPNFHAGSNVDFMMMDAAHHNDDDTSSSDDDDDDDDDVDMESDFLLAERNAGEQHPLDDSNTEDGEDDSDDSVNLPVAPMLAVEAEPAELREDTNEDNKPPNLNEEQQQADIAAAESMYIMRDDDFDNGEERGEIINRQLMFQRVGSADATRLGSLSRFTVSQTSSEDIASRLTLNAQPLHANSSSAAVAVPSQPISLRTANSAVRATGGPESLSLFVECGENNTFYTPRPLLLSSSVTNNVGLSQYHVLIRQNAYRNVGRLIGIAMQTNSLLPLPLARHVINYILRKPCTFYDFGFYNPQVFEQMRRLVLSADDAEHADETFDSMDLYFTISINLTDDGQETATIALVPGGDALRVTRHNVRQYVRLYTHYRMIGACVLALDALRAGVEDVLGATGGENDEENVLSALQAEDLRLILCGDQFGQFDVQMLQRLTSFFCESGSAASTVDDEKIKSWFWAIVDNLSEYERHDLLLFWTGSPNMPASEGALSQLPSVTIRPPDDQYFPTANTCISRLYLPAYSSRNIMKQKLLVAIKTKNFGFV